MLQFSTTLYNTTVRLSTRPCWRFTPLLSSSTSAPNPDPKNVTVKQDDGTLIKENEIVTKLSESAELNSSIDQKQQTKFNELKERISSITINSVKSDSLVKEKIQSAQTLNDLLDLMKLPNLSQDNALKIMSSITNWVNDGQVTQTDQNTVISNKIHVDTNKSKSSEVPRKKQVEEKAARKNEKSADIKQLRYLSIPLMIQELAILAEKGQRNTPLLREISNNIVVYAENLHAKQCANIFYSIAVLNYPDKALLEKISQSVINNNKNISSVTVINIMKSMGILKYKNVNLLTALCDLIIDEQLLLKPSQRRSILKTFATLGYKSEKALLMIKDHILPADMHNQFRVSEWLDFVWSLILLDLATGSHISSVLNRDFVKELKRSDSLCVSTKLKLLNINAAAQCTPNYDGNLLDKDSEVMDIPLERSKQKQAFVTALSETLANMFSSSNYFLTNLNSGMGFHIDALCCIDSDFKPVKTTDADNDDDDLIRVAIMLHDYTDFCRGDNTPLGITDWRTRILKSRGYHVLNVSYEHFSTEDNLIKRVKYLKERIKEVQDEST